MLIPDVNVLLYATIDALDQHDAARTWWETTLSGTHEVGLPVVCAIGFVRVATHRRLLDRPMTLEAAGCAVRSWTARPNFRVLTPGAAHLDLVLELLGEAGTAGHLNTDAQIAAHAVEHDAVVATNDTDFGRFRRVRTMNPVV